MVAHLGEPPRIGVEVVEDRTASARCDEGFLTLRRLRLRNRYDDGTTSATYDYDVVERAALDAVAIVLLTEDTPPNVCLRSALRPPLAFRDALFEAAPENPVYWEVPAGLIEPTEKNGEAGRRACCARETLEEVGLVVPPDSFSSLGPATVLSPGVIAEKLHYYVARVDPRDAVPPTEDGTPVEERAEVRFIPLAEALNACREGRIADIKTELSLRRATEWLHA